MSNKLPLSHPRNESEEDRDHAHLQLTKALKRVLFISGIVVSSPSLNQALFNEEERVAQLNLSNSSPAIAFSLKGFDLERNVSVARFALVKLYDGIDQDRETLYRATEKYFHRSDVTGAMDKIPAMLAGGIPKEVTKEFTILQLELNLDEKRQAGLDGFVISAQEALQLRDELLGARPN